MAQTAQLKVVAFSLFYIQKQTIVNLYKIMILLNRILALN